MDKNKIVFNNDGSVTISQSTYDSICLKMEENSPTYLYLLRQKEKKLLMLLNA